MIVGLFRDFLFEFILVGISDADSIFLKGLSYSFSKVYTLPIRMEILHCSSAYLLICFNYLVICTEIHNCPPEKKIPLHFWEMEKVLRLHGNFKSRNWQESWKFYALMLEKLNCCALSFFGLFKTCQIGDANIQHSLEHNYFSVVPRLNNDSVYLALLLGLVLQWNQRTLD